MEMDADSSVKEDIAELTALVNRLGQRVRQVLDTVSFPTGKLKFYKSKGAAQFTILPAKADVENRHIEKDGAVLLEVAPGNGDRKNPSWDWSKKISFALSTVDIMAIAHNADAVDIFHKHGDTSKKLAVSPGSRDGYMLTVAAGKGPTRVTVTVPLSEGEWHGIVRALVAQLPKLVGWK